MSISIAAQAQRDEVFRPNHDELPYYFGLSVGLSNNYLAFNRANRFLAAVSSTSIIDPYSIIEVNPINNLSLNLGLIGSLKLSKHVLLRANPTILINDAKNIMEFKVKATPDLSQKLNVSSAIVHLPVAFKFQSDRYNGFRYTDFMQHYFILGGKFDWDIASNKDKINPIGLITSIDDDLSVLKGTDFGAEIGVGLSFYLRYATISPEVKFSYGLSDLKKVSSTIPLLSNLDKVSSNFVYFTIHIEN